jgi:hypothetical protein
VAKSQQWRAALSAWACAKIRLNLLRQQNFVILRPFALARHFLGDYAPSISVMALSKTIHAVHASRAARGISIATAPDSERAVTNAPAENGCHFRRHVD